MKIPRLLSAWFAATALALTTSAQLNWASYDTSGNRVSAAAGAFDAASNTYTFTIPSGGARTFVTTNFVPFAITTGAATKHFPITFTMASTKGWTNVGSGSRAFWVGAFNYGALAPAATGQFSDDIGLCLDVKAGATWSDGEYFGGTSPWANLMGSYSAGTATWAKLGSGKGTGALAVGTIIDGQTIDTTFRLSKTSGGTYSMGSGTSSTAVAGIAMVDHTNGATTTCRLGYSGGTALVPTATTFNEFAIYFYNTGTAEATFTVANLTGLIPPPWFAPNGQPPANAGASYGQTVNVPCVAAGVTVDGNGDPFPITYQWQSSTDAVFTNPVTLVDATDATGTISGATTATLSLTSPPTTDTANRDAKNLYYRVVLTNAAGSLASTGCAVAFAEPQPPHIVVQPVGATKLVGESYTFSVTATGDAPLTYRWYRDSTLLSDGPSPSCAITGISASDAGTYTVTVSNTLGDDTSDGTAMLTVNEAVHLVTNPGDASLDAGAPLTLTADFAGTPAPTFQWYRSTDAGASWAALSGATATTYHIDSASAADAGWYKIIATNTTGTVAAPVSTASSTKVYVSVLSPTMTLTSATPAAGATGVNIDAPLSLTFNQPVTVGTTGKIVILTSAGAVLDTIDLAAGTVGLNSPAIPPYRPGVPYLTKSIGGVANFSYYPLIASGNTVKIYPRVPLSYGTSYYVTIDRDVILGADGAFAGVTENTTLAFSTKIASTATATNVVVAADGSGDFTTVQGALDSLPANPASRVTVLVRDGTYEEQVCVVSKNNITLTGESRTGTVISYLNNATLNGLGSPYHRGVIIFRYCAGITVSNLTVRNTTPKGGSQAEALILDGTQTSASTPSASQAVLTNLDLYSLQDTLQINGQAFISNAYIEGDVDFLWGTGPCFFRNCEFKAMTTQSYWTQVRNTAYGHGFVFANCTFSAAATSTGGTGPVGNSYFGRTDQNTPAYSEVVLLNCAEKSSALNPVAWLLNGISQAQMLGLFAEFNCTDLDTGLAIDATGRATWSRQWDATANASQITNYSNPYWVLGSNWVLTPTIGSSPANQCAAVGTPVTFTVTASSTRLAASYQWTKDGVDIAGANGPSLLVANTSTDDAGDYAVKVANDAGSITSATAQLKNDAFSVWIFGYAIDPADAAGAPTADPDSDGIPNREEFFLGGDPTVANTAILPMASHTMIGASSMLLFEFDRNTAAAATAFTVESSSDLINWTAAENGVAGVEIITTPVDATKDHITVALPAVANADGTVRLFARLRL